MMERKIVWILICTLISNSAYALIAPFLPLEFKEKGISGEMIGLMFAIYSVAVIVCSPCVGSTVAKIGNTNMISIGIAVMGIAFILFGLIPNFEETHMILSIGFALRFLQGAASAFVQTTCYSIATNDFPDKKEKIVGWVEALTGLGLICGPIIGSTLYSALGYAHTFFIYGAFLVFLSFIIKLNFPGDDDESELEEGADGQLLGSQQRVFEDDFSSFKNDVTPEKEKEQFADFPEPVDPADQVTLCKLLGSARFTMAALSSALCYFTYSSMQIGMFFAIWPVFYIPASIAVQYFPRRMDKRVTIILSALMTGIAFIFVGPSEIFGFPDSLILMGIGQALVGIFTAFMMIPGLPEMVESTIPLYPGQERAVNNLSSGIYNAFLGFGQVMAPAYGAIVTEAVGFRMTSDIVAIICFFFAVAYFALAGGITAFKASCEKAPKRQAKVIDDNDFVRQLAAKQDGDETVEEGRSRRSSSFVMMGPTSPGVCYMRMQNAQVDQGSPSQWNIPGGEASSPLRRLKRTPLRHRVMSEIDNTPSPSPYRMNFNDVNRSIDAGQFDSKPRTDSFMRV